MLDKINELMKNMNDSERAFEELRNKNEDEIKALIENSQAYKELQDECNGDYKCFISISSSVSVSICYKLYSTCEKKSVCVSEEGIDDSRNRSFGMDTQKETQKLICLATKFYEVFYLDVDSEIG